MSEFEFSDEVIDTGLLVTATVNDPDAITAAEIEATLDLSPDGIQAAKALVQKIDMETSQLAMLARDVAYDIMLWPELLKKYSLTQAQYDFLKDYNQFYKTLLNQLTAEWHAIKNSQERVSAQALAALEATLPTLAGRMVRQTEKLADVVEATKALSSIAGLGGNRPTNAGAAGFEINIDLGGDTRITIGTPKDADTSAQAPGPAPLREITQGTAGGAALPAKPEGEGGHPQLRHVTEGAG